MKSNTLLAGTLAFLSLAFEARAQAACDGRYHWIDVPGTKCIDGTATGFQYICRSPLGAAGPLIVFLQGEGACATGDTCDCQPDANGNCQGGNATSVSSHFDRVQSFDGQPWGQERTGSVLPWLFGQTAMYSGPNSPFSGHGDDWNLVYIPACTGDAHTGDRERDYTTSDGRTIHAWHHGFTNVGLDLLRMRPLFPAPREVAIIGDSGGGVGADCNLFRFREQWAGTPMLELNDAGFPYGATSPTAPWQPLAPGVPQWFAEWGAWHRASDGRVVPDSCPALVPDGAPGWSSWFMRRYNQLQFADVRKAFVDDYSDATVQFFLCLTGAAPDPDGTCDSAVANGLRWDSAFIGDDPNYRHYYHQGICHTEREQDGNNATNGSDPSCDYDVTTQSGVRFSDWVNAWIANSAAFVNVE